MNFGIENLIKEDHKRWYKNADFLVRIIPVAWFPVEIFCDVINGKYVPKKEFKSYVHSGNMGSATIGFKECDRELVIKTLNVHGKIIEEKNMED